MIRTATFFAVLLAAMWVKSEGGPLWPVFLTLALAILWASLAFERGREAWTSGLIGAGILAMCWPLYGGMEQPWFSVFGVALWTVLALVVSRYNLWSARFLVLMPIGYAVLAVVPSDAAWTVVEVSGVVALLCAGGPLDEAILAMGRRAGNLRGVAARGGDARDMPHGRSRGRSMALDRCGVRSLEAQALQEKGE